MANGFSPEDWGLHAAEGGELSLGNHGLVGLAHKCGTPLHVVNERRLKASATEFLEKARASYPGKTTVHYAMKCNSVPGIVQLIYSSGLNVEVVTEYELQLAHQIGFTSEQIIVNGPGKTCHFLESCITSGVRLIVVDSLEELGLLGKISSSLICSTGILLRVNPGFIPRGMNHGSATASRRGSPFGLDLKGGEIEQALEIIRQSPGLRFQGFHMHIGTGIQHPASYGGALSCLPLLRTVSRDAGFTVEILDVGGGYGTPTMRGMTTWEMAKYESLGILPRHRRPATMHPLESFFHTISDTVLQSFEGDPLPEIIFEPGRCITGPNQFLLLTVQAVKERKGVGTWVITDGGVSTVSLPTYYECHEVLLCNEVHRPVAQRVTLNGPACFAGDIIYRNIPMPHLEVGDTLAIMDSGAYFTSLESSFGFPRPAIIAVNGATVRLLRTRETFEDMIARDDLD